MGLFRRKKEDKKAVETKTEEPKIEEKSKKTTEKETDSLKSVKTNKKEENTKKSNTMSKKETESKSKKPIYRVIYDKDARVWLIKKDGAKRTIASYPTKEEALNRVKDLSVSNDLNYIVHKKDGKFQKK